MVQLTDDDLSNVPTKLGEAEVASLRVGTESAIVPNLELIERRVFGLAKATKRT